MAFGLYITEIIPSSKEGWLFFMQQGGQIYNSIVYCKYVIGIPSSPRISSFFLRGLTHCLFHTGLCQSIPLCSFHTYQHKLRQPNESRCD